MAHVRVSVLLPEDLLRRFERLAAARRERRSTTMSRALQKYLDDYDAETRAFIEDLNAEADSITEAEREEDLKLMRRAMWNT